MVDRPTTELLPLRDGTSAHPDEVVAALVGVSKSFGPTRALSEVTVELRRGRVTALVGENGAGKSTCVKTFAGLYHPDGGTVQVRGGEVSLRSPLDARRHGIAVVSQHPALFGELSIAENIFAGKELRTTRGLLDHAAMRDRARRQLERVGLRYDPRVPANRLSTSEQQMVEIAKALASDAPVLILDEPTATLSSGEVARLFAVLRELREDGVAMLFVGHRLEEIFEIADDLVILRDGELVHTCPASEVTPRETVAHMVGRELSDLYPERSNEPGEVLLQVEGLTTPSGVEDVSFHVRAGEVVGLAGLVGSGRSEVARVLFGIDPADAGTVRLDGTVLRNHGPAEAMAKGIAYVSEDRRGQSIVEDFSILENATLPVISRATRLGLVMRRLQLGLVSGPLDRMSLRFASYDQPAGTLSGGNQQKVVLAKWLATNPKLLVLDEPTQGIDVGAKAEVHALVAALAEQGIGVLLISSDLPEVLGMSDRVLVMRRGRLVGEFDREDATEHAVTYAATGATESPRQQVEEAEAHAAAPATEAAAESAGRGSGSGLLHRLVARREAGLLAVLLVLAVPITVINPNFLSASNLSDVGSEAGLIGVVALGQMLVILTRNIDVSVASTIGLTAYVFGRLVRGDEGMPVLLAVVLTVLLGVGLGLVNGSIVAYGRVPSIVVTLGTLYIYRGVDSILSDGDQISPGQVPESWIGLVSSRPLGVPFLVWFYAVLASIFAAALWYSRTGRQFYQVGSNPEGAAANGVAVDRRILLAFTVCGALAGLGGALWAGKYGIVDGQTAYGEELRVIATVVVGGVALRGGFGTVAGVVLGTLVLFVIYNALTLARVDATAIQAFYGAAIIAAVGLDVLLARRARSSRTVV